MWTKCCNINLLLLLLLLISVINLATVSGSYIGCYEERNIISRLLYQDYAIFHGTLTPDLCIKHCKGRGFAYAGVQYKYECFCSKFRPSYRYIVEEEDCNTKCDGDNGKSCGGVNRMNVYDLEDLQENPVQKNYVGCVNSTEKRLLVHKSKLYNETLTPERCMAFCYRGGFMYAGLTNSECLCGDIEMDNIKKLLVSNDDCDTKCGNERFTCGGHYRTSIYTTGITGYDKLDILGCYQDNQGRILSGFFMYYRENLTPKLCYNFCRGFGFKYAGLEVGHECHCGNVKLKPSYRRREDECSVPCAGDPTKSCGGNWRIYVYSIEGGAYKVEPGYLGCYDPGVTIGTLEGSSITFKDTNSPKTCIDHCRRAGFKYAGVLQSVHCVCGNEPPNEAYIRKESECTMECPGDPNKECGGIYRMMVYEVDGKS